MNGEPKVVVASLEEVKRRLMERMAADGVQFRVCANCGTTYPLGPEDNETVCSERCGNAFIAYLSGGEL